MAILTIDTSDKLEALRACRNMLNELIGEEPAPSVLGAPIKPAVKTEVVGEQEETVVGEVVTLHDADTAGTEPESETTPPADANTEVDENRVPFNPDMCARATIPFYASGKQKGQWKRRVGVAHTTYDAWYASALAAVAPADTPPKDDAPIDTAGAFGGTAKAEPNADIPQDCGAFFGWISKQQAASRLSADDIGGAYIEAGVKSPAELFPPNSDADVAGRIAKLYAILSAKAGA